MLFTLIVSIKREAGLDRGNCQDVQEVPKNTGF